MSSNIVITPSAPSTIPSQPAEFQLFRDATDLTIKVKMKDGDIKNLEALTKKQLISAIHIIAQTHK